MSCLHTKHRFLAIVTVAHVSKPLPNSEVSHRSPPTFGHLRPSVPITLPFLACERNVARKAEAGSQVAWSTIVAKAGASSPTVNLPRVCNACRRVVLAELNDDDVLELGVESKSTAHDSVL